MYEIKEKLNCGWNELPAQVLAPRKKRNAGRIIAFIRRYWGRERRLFNSWLETTATSIAQTRFRRLLFPSETFTLREAFDIEQSGMGRSEKLTSRINRYNCSWHASSELLSSRQPTLSIYFKILNSVKICLRYKLNSSNILSNNLKRTFLI